MPSLRTALALDFVSIVLGDPDHDLAVQRHGEEFDVEPIAIFVFPGSADPVPECLLACFSDLKRCVCWFIAHVSSPWFVSVDDCWRRWTNEQGSSEAEPNDL